MLPKRCLGLGRGSKPMESHVGLGAPPILEPIFSGDCDVHWILVRDLTHGHPCLGSLKTQIGQSHVLDFRNFYTNANWGAIEDLFRGAGLLRPEGGHDTERRAGKRERAKASRLRSLESRFWRTKGEGVQLGPPVAPTFKHFFGGRIPY